MNNEELKRNVRIAANEILKTEVAISPVNLLMKIGILSKKDYEDWRMGRVPYLERVCRTNLNKLAVALEELHRYAMENDLKPSKTAYMKCRKGEKIRLRFSKNHNPILKEAYSTHFVDTLKAAEHKQTSTDTKNQYQSTVATDFVNKG
jgi:uncharacterized protein Veg